jgi:hypothetical protein
MVTFMDRYLRQFSCIVRLADPQQHQEERVQQQGKTSDWKPVWLNLDYNWALIDLGDIASQYLVNAVTVQPDLRYGHYLEDDEFVTLGKGSPAIMPIIKHHRFSRSGLRHLNRISTSGRHPTAHRRGGRRRSLPLCLPRGHGFSKSKESNLLAL